MAGGASGHLEQLPSGRFRVDVYAGTDPLTGRRLRFRQTVRTEQQARIVLGKLLAQIAEGRQPETGVTVAELLRRYMAVAELDGSTRRTYEGYIRRTILPALGSMELRKVRGPVLDMFYARLHRCGDLACSGKPFTEHSAFPAIDVTPTAARPVWVQVASVIREAIATVQLAPGEPLPSARQVAHRNGLPVTAIHQALAVLADEGLIAVRQGRRAVVAGELAGARPPLRAGPGDPGHYSASQLLAGGIDLRNTAARLGHGGGGATTLRHYADPISEVDRRAAAYLAQLTASTASDESTPNR